MHKLLAIFWGLGPQGPIGHGQMLKCSQGPPWLILDTVDWVSCSPCSCITLRTPEFSQHIALGLGNELCYAKGLCFFFTYDT